MAEEKFERGIDMNQITEERIIELEGRVQQLETELKLIKQQTAQAIEVISIKFEKC
jgi:hypothetical protein